MFQFISGKRDLSDIVRNVEDILGFSLALVRIVILTYRNEDFTRLVQMIKLFWDPCKCDQQIKMELTLIRRFTYQLQRLFLLTTATAVVLVVISPLLQNTIPTGIRAMEGHVVLYGCAMIGQIISEFYSALFVCFLDCMYLGFCAEIVIQFRILSQTLQELKSDSNTFNGMEILRVNEMRSCIITLFSRFVKEFKQAFSLVLLSEFVIDGPWICAELLAALESHAFETQARHVMVFAVITFQLAFFCIPANHITNEAMAVSDAVYFSNWYSQHNPSLKVPLLLIIQNSQTEITLKGGGLVTINAGTIVN
ncbi:hypothetical protein ILUMI_12573, partial [Ignelater luminosus]